LNQPSSARFAATPAISPKFSLAITAMPSLLNHLEHFQDD